MKRLFVFACIAGIMPFICSCVEIDKVPSDLTGTWQFVKEEIYSRQGVLEDSYEYKDRYGDYSVHFTENTATYLEFGEVDETSWYTYDSKNKRIVFSDGDAVIVKKLTSSEMVWKEDIEYIEEHDSGKYKTTHSNYMVSYLKKIQ